MITGRKETLQYSDELPPVNLRPPAQSTSRSSVKGSQP
jgi:hypothetical protein